jgi:hypothetical protein
MSILCKHSYNALDTPELRFFSLGDEDLISILPVLFYKGDVKELAVAKKDKYDTRIIISCITHATESVSDKIANKLDKELNIEDTCTFNFMTGDMVIKNGDRNINYFEWSPNINRTIDSTAPACGFCYSGRDGNDKIGYFYVSNKEKTNMLYLLSRMKEKKFCFAEEGECTAFGISLAGNLMYSPVSNDVFKVTDTFALQFSPEESCDIEDLSIVDALLKIGDRAFKKEDKKVITEGIVPRYGEENYDDDGVLPFPIVKVSQVKEVFPLSEVLSHVIVPSTFPIDLELDMVLQPCIKKITCIDKASLILYIRKGTNLQMVNADTIGLFDDFEVTYKEEL